jgi:hypothetical protein
MARLTGAFRWLVSALTVTLVGACGVPSAPTAAAPSSAALATPVPVAMSASPAGTAGATTSSAAPATRAVGRLPGEPDPALTPGAINPAVTQATIGSTICRSGWTATVRPPSSYTNALKVQQIAQYGYADASTAAYEEDHLIPLELGGAPRDPRNLWPEPYTASLTGGRSVGARVKDAYETALKHEVCVGTISLASARVRIGIHWVHYDFGIPLTPTATPRPTTSAATAARPTTAPASLAVRLTMVPSSVTAGSGATVAARTSAGATCTISFTLPSGRVSTVAALLQSKTADRSGAVSWTWTITSSTKPGTARVAVRCSLGGRSASASGTVAIT